MSTVSTYNILSFCTNCHFCFLINFFFKCRLSKAVSGENHRAFSNHWKSTPRQNLESNFQPLSHVKGVGRGTYDTLPGERHWSWYRMTYCRVKYTGCVTIWRIVMLHWLWYRMTHCQVKGTSRGTVWHIAMWKALVMVPYDTFPGERHWTRYRKTHCQMKGAGRGSVWYIARWKTLVVVPYDTLPCEIHWPW